MSYFVRYCYCSFTIFWGRNFRCKFNKCELLSFQRNSIYAYAVCGSVAPFHPILPITVYKCWARHIQISTLVELADFYSFLSKAHSDLSCTGILGRKSIRCKYIICIDQHVIQEVGAFFPHIPYRYLERNVSCTHQMTQNKTSINVCEVLRSDMRKMF